MSIRLAVSVEYRLVTNKQTHDDGIYRTSMASRDKKTPGFLQPFWNSLRVAGQKDKFAIAFMICFKPFSNRQTDQHVSKHYPGQRAVEAIQRKCERTYVVRRLLPYSVTHVTATSSCRFVAFCWRLFTFCLDMSGQSPCSPRPGESLAIAMRRQINSSNVKHFQTRVTALSVTKT